MKMGEQIAFGCKVKIIQISFGMIWKAKMLYISSTENRNLGHSDADIEKWTLTTFACSGATFKFCNLGHFNEIPAFP